MPQLFTTWAREAEEKGDQEGALLAKHILAEQAQRLLQKWERKKYHWAFVMASLWRAFTLATRQAVCTYLGAIERQTREELMHHIIGERHCSVATTSCQLAARMGASTAREHSCLIRLCTATARIYGARERWEAVLIAKKEHAEKKACVAHLPLFRFHAKAEKWCKGQFLYKQDLFQHYVKRAIREAVKAGAKIYSKIVRVSLKKMRSVMEIHYYRDSRPLLSHLVTQQVPTELSTLHD